MSTINVVIPQMDMSVTVDVTTESTTNDVKQQLCEMYDMNEDTFNLTYQESILCERQLLVSNGICPNEHVEVKPTKSCKAMVYLRQCKKDRTIKGLRDEIVNNGSKLKVYLNAKVCRDPLELGALLKVAVRYSNTPALAVSLLLSHGAPVGTEFGGGRTILMLLCEPKYYNVLSSDTTIEILSAILKHCGPDHSILNKSDDDQCTPLMYAASLEVDVGVMFVYMLLEAGANVNAANKKGKTPLMYSCSNEGRSAESITDLLIKRGAFTSQTVDGRTDLMYASANENQPASFIQRVIDITDLTSAVNHQTMRKKKTPLMYACGNEGPFAFDIVATLLDNGVIVSSVNDKNYEGRTALMYAATSEGECATSIVRLLLTSEFDWYEFP